MRKFTEEMGFLPVKQGNHLVATDLKNTQKKGMDNDDDYLMRLIKKVMSLPNITLGTT